MQQMNPVNYVVMFPEIRNDSHGIYDEIKTIKSKLHHNELGFNLLERNGERNELMARLIEINDDGETWCGSMCEDAMIWDKFATIFKQPSIDNNGDYNIISLIDEQDDDLDNTHYIYPPMKRRRIDDAIIESKQEEDTVTGGQCCDEIMTEMNDDQVRNKEEVCIMPCDMDNMVIIEDTDTPNNIKSAQQSASVDRGMEHEAAGTTASGAKYDNVTDDIDYVDDVEENVMIEGDNVCSEECDQGTLQEEEQDNDIIEIGIVTDDIPTKIERVATDFVVVDDEMDDDSNMESDEEEESPQSSQIEKNSHNLEDIEMRRDETECIVPRSYSNNNASSLLSPKSAIREQIKDFSISSQAVPCTIINVTPTTTTTSSTTSSKKQLCGSKRKLSEILPDLSSCTPTSIKPEDKKPTITQQKIKSGPVSLMDQSDDDEDSDSDDDIQSQKDEESSDNGGQYTFSDSDDDEDDKDIKKYNKGNDDKMDKKPIKSTPNKPRKQFKNVEYIDNIPYAFGVIPIYSKYYLECADFPTNLEKFPWEDFGKKCIQYACLSDMEIRKEMRRSTRDRTKTVRASLGPYARPKPTVGIQRKSHRTEWIPDAAKFKFLEGAAGDAGIYKDIFRDCFSRKKREWLDIKLIDYMDKKLIKRRDGRRPIPFGKRHGIVADKLFILYCLLKIWDYYMTVGVTADDKSEWLPWHEPDDIIIEKFGDLNIEVVDLCEVDTDDENDEIWRRQYEKGKMREENRLNGIFDDDGDVLIKQEPSY